MMERLFVFKEQPSSHSVLKVLDNIIGMMLEPLVQYTDYGFELAASLLCLLQDNRRKITSYDKHKVASGIFLPFVRRDRETLFSALMASGVERGIIVEYVRMFLASSRCPKLTVEYGPLRRHLDVLLGMYNRFVQAVIEKYNRVLYYQAGLVVARRAKMGITISHEDAYQNIKLTAMRTLGRFQSENGTITSYLLKWAKYSDSSKYLIGVGESFGITRSERTKIAKGDSAINNLGVDVEKGFNVADETPTQEEAYHTNQMYSDFTALVSRSRLAKNNRFGMAVCRIPYQLSDQEKALLRGSN